MLKLYKITEDELLFWETWDNGKVHTVHWGRLGTKGESKELKSTLFSDARKTIQKEIDAKITDGFRPIDQDDHFTLMIEYPIDGMGGKEDLDKRHRLQGRMDEVLGWTGLGHCDGGSIGSGTMEVCCYVVDFALAKSVVESDLKDTEFANYSRIYDENAE